MYRRAGEIFKELKSETRPRDLVKQMSGGQRQAVAIARTMLSEAKIVLMDEPTAAISVRQVAEVLNLIRHLRDQGIAVVLISHRMPDVFTVADRVIVMRRGRKVADKKIAASSPEEVTGLITGAIELRGVAGRTENMAITLDQTIAHKQHSWLAGVLNSQTFWVLIAVIARLHLPVLRHRLLRHHEEPLQHHPQRHLRRDHRARHDAGHHHRRHRPVGRLGAVPVQHGPRRHHACRLRHRGRHRCRRSPPRSIVGAFNGVLIAYLGFPPFVVTLGMLSIARSLAMVASNNTVVFEFGPDHDMLLALGGGAWLFGIANPVLYMVVLALITGFVLRWTRFGRHVFAIGGNEHAATLTGVPVKPIKVAVYMISALSAGIAGIIQTGWLGAVTTNIGAGMELQVIAAAVIGGANLAGGIGTAFGALVGAALIEVIRNSLGLLGINAFWQGTFIGGAIILAVLFDRVRTFRRE